MKIVALSKERLLQENFQQTHCRSTCSMIIMCVLSNRLGMLSDGPCKYRHGQGLSFEIQVITGLQILLNKKLIFSGTFPKIGLGPFWSLGPSKKHGTSPFGPGLGLDPSLVLSNRLGMLAVVLLFRVSQIRSYIGIWYVPVQDVFLSLRQSCNEFFQKTLQGPPSIRNCCVHQK